jgi:hypothetical protein
LLRPLINISLSNLFYKLDLLPSDADDLSHLCSPIKNYPGIRYFRLTSNIIAGGSLPPMAVLIAAYKIIMDSNIIISPEPIKNFEDPRWSFNLLALKHEAKIIIIASKISSEEVAVNVSLAVGFITFAEPSVNSTIIMKMGFGLLVSIS